MKIRTATFILTLALAVLPSLEASAIPAPPEKDCHEQLSRAPLPAAQKKTSDLFCATAVRLEGCVSQESRSIAYWDKKSTNPNAKKILVFGAFHGDEPLSVTLSLMWMDRLTNLDPRNHWRFVPVTNPDGLAKKTRSNARGVDINRNFPTKGWETDAALWWKNTAKSSPTKFPGTEAGSEPETRCALKIIDDYKPDLVVSIHTPYGVLDFDGPRIAGVAGFKRLRWKSLGHFPGSLGRYLWRDHHTPVLTVELHANMTVKELENYGNLQDLIGTVAFKSLAK